MSDKIILDYDYLEDQKKNCDDLTHLAEGYMQEIEEIFGSIMPDLEDLGYWYQGNHNPLEESDQVLYDEKQNADKTWDDFVEKDRQLKQNAENVVTKIDGYLNYYAEYDTFFSGNSSYVDTVAFITQQNERLKLRRIAEANALADGMDFASQDALAAIDALDLPETTKELMKKHLLEQLAAWQEQLRNGDALTDHNGVLIFYSRDYNYAEQIGLLVQLAFLMASNEMNLAQGLPAVSTRLTTRAESAALDRIPGYNIFKTVVEGIAGRTIAGDELSLLARIMRPIGATMETIGYIQLVKGLGKLVGFISDHIEAKNFTKLLNKLLANPDNYDEIIREMELSGKYSDDTIRKLKAFMANQDAIIIDGSHLVNGKLLPNVKYMTGEHGYIYVTDADGRITEVIVGDLKFKIHDGRLIHNPNSPGKLPGDHAGHLIADMFGGSPELDNIVSQLSDVNLSKYKRLENIWKKALEEGQTVEINIKINYDSSGLRPISFDISYKVDGWEYIEFINNI